MYIYNIGYHSYEENEDVQLYHKQKFGKEDFDNIVIKATCNVLKKHDLKKGNEITFQCIFYPIIDDLIKNFGFNEVKFTAKFSVFGWADLMDEKDWENDRDEQLNLLTKAITKKIKR